MSIQRQAMSIMTRLYTIYPDLERQLSCRAAINLLSAMAISGMFLTPEIIPDTNRSGLYVKSGIVYELNIRAIARAIGIEENKASKFVRGCFAASDSILIYPYTISNFGSEYEAVAKYLNFDITREVIMYLAGDQYLPSGGQHDKKLPLVKCNQQMYGTFYLLNRIIKLDHGYNDLPAKLYFAEVIKFIQSHPDQKYPRSEFTSKKIFIDEVIDYAREYDEVRFEQFNDTIATMLLTIDESSIMPDCRSFMLKLGLDELLANIKIIHDAFADFMKSGIPESEHDYVYGTAAIVPSVQPIP